MRVELAQMQEGISAQKYTINSKEKMSFEIYQRLKVALIIEKPCRMSNKQKYASERGAILRSQKEKRGIINH